MIRELILVRHAKSASPAGVADFDRELDNRGRRAAANLSGWLTQLGPIDAVCVSPARRTQQTYEHSFAPAALRSVPLINAPTLYEASTEEMLDVVRTIPQSAQRVVVIGHNPGSQDLAILLATSASESQARFRVLEKYPTCAAARFTSERDWCDWGRQTADLAEFRTPARDGIE